MESNKDYLERYSRNIALPALGVEGQKKLKESSVLIIGAGGLGSPAAAYLAAAGVGRIGIADADTVSLSNLQRQIMHRTRDLGVKKTESAKRFLTGLEPDAVVETFDGFVAENNVLELIKKYDFVLDCTDNFPSKFLINDACVFANKPFTHAGVLGFGGQIMTVIPNQTPCYRCLFEDEPPKEIAPSSVTEGILGAVAGVIGSLQALEAVKYLSGCGELLTGRMLTFDGLAMKFHTVKLAVRNESCLACGKSAQNRFGKLTK